MKKTITLNREKYRLVLLDLIKQARMTKDKRGKTDYYYELMGKVNFLRDLIYKE